MKKAATMRCFFCFCEMRQSGWNILASGENVQVQVASGNIGTIISATMLMILISGLTAGPAVSL